MRIVSPFHDYYDSAMQTGMDHDSVWVRKTEDVFVPQETHAFNVWSHPFKEWLDRANRVDLKCLNRWSWESRRKVKSDVLCYDVSAGAVMFAGKVYPWVALKENLFNGHGKEMLYTWSLKETKTWLDERGIELSTARDMLEKTTDEERLNAWFAHHDQDVGENLVSMDVPIVMVRGQTHRYGRIQSFREQRGSMTVNPDLSAVGFARQLDPWGAFQELSMFIEGVLRQPEVNTVPITDQDRLVQHGFDHWSFKTPPSDIPKRRKHR